jgi:hypothetical protein
MTIAKMIPSHSRERADWRRTVFFATKALQVRPGVPADD